MNHAAFKHGVVQFLIACIVVISFSIKSSASETDYRATFDAIHQIVEDHFFDPALSGLNWMAIGNQFRERAAASTSLDHFSATVNEMLATLRTSHTRLYTSREPECFQLRSVFGDPDTSYPGIGILTKSIDGQTFVSGVLEGSPAHLAGLRVGDRIDSINGQPFHPIASFEERVGTPLPVAIQRESNDANLLQINVTPTMLQPVELFVNAIKGSARVMEHESKRIGYVRMWSWAGDPYRDALHEVLQSEPFRNADALILDLRDGWGGANPDDVNLFNPQVPALTVIDRDGLQLAVDAQWRKPVALLVNGETRSGKEIVARAFQKHGIGPIIGERTAGAVVGGRPFRVHPDMLLYLATVDVHVDGERLEGSGVKPDVEVAFELPYANGDDPQLQAAVETLSRSIKP